MSNRPTPRRPGTSAAVALLPVVLPIMLTTALLAGCSGGDDAAQAPATTAATSSGAPAATTSPGAGATPGATPGATTAASPSVTIGQSATLKQDITVRVVGVTKVQLTAEGVGEIAGAGASVELRVRNASTGSIALGDLVVNAYYGAARTPAVPNTTDGAGGQELAGNLKAGKSKTGTYLFAVPSKSFSTLDVEVSSGDSPYVITFVHG